MAAIEQTLCAPRPKQVAKGKFAGDVLVLTLGSLLSQVVSIAAAPILTRLFAPQAFGLAMVFTSITGVIGVAVCLRYDRSIIVPKDDEDAIYLIQGSLLGVLGFTVLSLGLVTVTRGPLSRWLNAPELTRYLWLLPVYVFFFGCLAALNTWGTRKQRFVLLTAVQFISVLCYVGGSLAAGLAGLRTGGVLIGTTVAGVMAAALLMYFQTRRDYSGGFRRHDWNRLRSVLKRYARFPKYSIASALVNSGSTELPTFFLSGFFSMSVVGQYALCSRLLRLPMGLIGANIARVFSQRAAEAKHQGRLPGLVENIFTYLVALGMFPFLVLAFVGRDLFVLVFGQTWADAGLYAQILSLWAFFWFISTSLSVVLDIVEEQAFELRVNLLVLVTRFASLIVGCRLRDPRYALGLFAAADALVSCYYCFAIVRRCQAPVSRLLRVLGLHFVAFVPAGLVLFGLARLGIPPAGLVASSVALIGLYYAALLRIDPRVREVVALVFQRLIPRGIAAH